VRQPPVRLGVIDYLNVAPVYDALRQESSLLPGAELVAGVPSAMNAALLAGEIDLSNVSSVAFGQHADEWLLVPGLSVAAQEKVESVLLFSWHEDWRALDGGSIALSSDSATSAALVRLLSEERYGARPQYVTMAPDLDAMLERADAALIIGDVALFLDHEAAGVTKIDLGDEWTLATGLPFVYALWAGWPGAVAPEDVAALLDARDSGVQHVDAIAAAHAPDDPARQAVISRYLRDNIRYRLGAREEEGLKAFYRYATELGLASFDGELRIYHGDYQAD